MAAGDALPNSRQAGAGDLPVLPGRSGGAAAQPAQAAGGAPEPAESPDATKKHQFREYQRAWAKANRQHLAEYKRAWMLANAARVATWPSWKRERKCQYMKDYYRQHQETMRAYSRAHYAANRVRYQAWSRAYYEANGERIRRYARAYNAAHRRFLKETVIARYGGSCASCGLADIRALCIDHVNGDGHAHRRAIGRGNQGRGGSRMYEWLVAHDCPPGFQVLCANCNLIKELAHDGPRRRRGR